MNFDAYCAGKIDEAGYFAQLITKTLSSWKKQINTHIMEPQDTARERKEVVDFLKSATKQLEQICRDIKSADMSFETAIESGKRHWSTYESKNKRSKKISIKEDKEQATRKTQIKPMFNKIISKLKRYAKDNGCYMSIEKFGVYDNTGSVYVYFTTNRYSYDGSSVRFTFDLRYEIGAWTDFKPRFTVRCLEESDAPGTDEQEFYSYEDAYEFILNYIIKYGNMD
jgi:DNA primase catalytic subunit